ncbi:hypothetical protein [Cohnella caldifontis]|uniref:hypothetical protein n=1 Tax=Cohnella caldifontis TaxID=3027471 RepID=UPI0023ED804F|nr:hypothetical protein [Cohnella sp. YIM B05605]
MRQGLILTGLGIAVWAVATLFFRLFGHWVLSAPGDAHFGSSLFLLELLTLLVLIGLALAVRLKWFPQRGSAVKFGYAGAAVGLLLDAVSIWRRDAVFPDFSEGQHQAFAIWMTSGYALMLLVPAIVDRLVRVRPDQTTEIEDLPETEAMKGERPDADVDFDRTT